VTSLKYIWRNVKRHKLRSSLTVLSIGFSLALLTVLLGYMAMQDVWGDEAQKHNRIVVMSKEGFAGLLPIATVEKVREMPAVKAAVPYSWFGGEYKEEKMSFAQFATDARHVMNVWDEYKMDPAQLSEWQKDRQGCVVDRRLAEKRGWKLGEKIPIKGTYFPFDLDLTLRGYFDAPQYTDTLWFHREYLDEGLRTGNAKARGVGKVGMIFVKTSNDAAIPGLIDTIDDTFESSDNPTRTQTEAAFAQMFVDMLGGMRLFIIMIGAVVVFALTLVAANAMAMSTRERTTEVAVLKAIGFPRGRVLRMILGEACLIALFGGLLGVTMGCGLLEVLHAVNSQYFPFRLSEFAGLWLGWLAVISAFVGLASGIVPAVLAARRSVIDGLRRVI
jgi:putative ABC transport system permease protein